MLRAVLPAFLLLLPGCAPDLEAILDDIDGVPRATDSTGATTSPTPTVTGDSGEDPSDGIMTSTAGEADSSGSDGANAGDTSTTGATAPGDTSEEILPEIVEIELPGEVNVAGPVPITVQTKNAESVRVNLDGIDMGELAGAGKDVFVGEFAVKGAADNGTHDVEVIATRDDHEVSKKTSFNVSAPPAGKPAWSVLGALGTQTNRIALTAQGDVLEGGLHIGAGISRPAIRKRSGTDGADLWGKKVLLSDHEGYVADLAVAPDGNIWVAMNVKEANQQWLPHILLLTPDGMPTGVDRQGSPDTTLRAIAADDEGGCFAVGFAVAGGGDLDVSYQGINSKYAGSVMDTWDYQVPNVLAHSFSDAATDIVIDGDIAWVVGMAVGKHDKLLTTTRGLILPIAIHTGVEGKPIIAPLIEPWKNSMFLGVALQPGGLVVSGSGCEKDCGGVQRIEISRYTFAGLRTWFQPEKPAEGARGSEVVVDSQGTAVVAGASVQGGILRGQVFARKIGTGEPLPIWAYWFPPSKESSEALTVAIDPFDRLFFDGYVTVGGSPQSWLVRASP